MKTPRQIYIGYDPREHGAYEIAHKSLMRRASGSVLITPLSLPRLEAWGLMTRPYTRYSKGGLWDTISDAPASTDFAISRFLTPLLAQQGWALFADCDMLFMADIEELFALTDDKYAVMVVKHDQNPVEKTKMDGSVQTVYPRKNWSSIIMWNCDHPANQQLTLSMINQLPGRDLHRFCWLSDDQIGSLPLEWNWLVEVEEIPATPKIAHYTLGGPWLPDWEQKAYDYLWLQESQYFANEG